LFVKFRLESSLQSGDIAFTKIQDGSLATLNFTMTKQCTPGVVYNDFLHRHVESGSGNSGRWLIYWIVFVFITFCVSRRRRKIYCGHPRLSVCLSVYLSAAACLHYCADPDVTCGVVGDAPSSALLVGFAIGARVALLWQHYGNAWLRCRAQR